MSEAKSIFQRWSGYRPSKTALFWSCALSVVVAIVVGFTWGGWVTGRTANNMAMEAGKKARIDLAASICVSRFLKGENVKADWLKLKNTSSWNRADLLEKNGWVTIAGQSSPVDGAADACAEELVKMEPPQGNQPAQANGQAKTSSQTVQ